MPIDEAIEAISEWFSSQMNLEVSWFEIPDRQVFVFRAESDSSQGDPELEITRVAFEDVPVDQIISDLEDHEVISVFQRDPTMHLTYKSDRTVPHFERMPLRVDGRMYRVVRDRDHNVKIFDDQDRLLENFPSEMTVLPQSIYRRSRQRWSEEIRNWRGPDQ